MLRRLEFAQLEVSGSVDASVSDGQPSGLTCDRRGFPFGPISVMGSQVEIRPDGNRQTVPAPRWARNLATQFGSILGPWLTDSRQRNAYVPKGHSVIPAMSALQTAEEAVSRSTFHSRKQNRTRIVSFFILILLEPQRLSRRRDSARGQFRRCPRP